MPIYSKHPLSGSFGGLPVFVTASASGNAVEIHTVQATATGVLEMVSLWLSISATSGSYSPRIQYDSGATAEIISLNGEGTINLDLQHGVQVISNLPRSSTDAVIEAFNSGATEDMFVWGHVDRIATG